MSHNRKGQKRSRAQEDRTASRYDGQRQPGSGSGWSRKNDVRTKEESIELKTTGAKQFTLRLNDLLQAEKHALQDDRRMVFGIEFQTKGRTFMVITEEDYLELRERRGSAVPEEEIAAAAEAFPDQHVCYSLVCDCGDEEEWEFLSPWSDEDDVDGP